LAAYVHNQQFDFAEFKRDVRTCVRFLDDVLDVNTFALPDNREASQNLRRLGLGVMGLADCLIQLGLRYDRPDGRAMIEQIMGVMREEAIKESEHLGHERGVYPLYRQHQEQIPHAPRRNVAVLTVAPTGTTSMLMGVSSGIEPVFSPFIWRKIGSDYRAMIAPLFQTMLESHPPTAAFSREGRSLGPTAAPNGPGRWDWDKVTAAISANHGSVDGLEWVPAAVREVFVCAHDVAPLDHVRMQGAVQRAFDHEGYAANSLSKTINMPNHASVEDVEAAYSEAYRTGCKGITVYRDGSRQFQVLSTSKDEQKSEVASEIASEIAAPTTVPTVQANEEIPTAAAPAVLAATGPRLPYERPNRLTGVTDMVKLTDLVAGSKRTFLITVNTHEGQPLEVIVVSGRAGDEANADSEALGRVVSIALQHGVPVEALQKTLRGINGGLYGSYNGRLVASKADLIAVALESTLPSGEVRQPEQALLFAPAAADAYPTQQALSRAASHAAGRCPNCQAEALMREEGCIKCQACGYSKCG
jgi:ribonucleoside-diphosphate reductase alpha chain